MSGTYRRSGQAGALAGALLLAACSAGTAPGTGTLDFPPNPDGAPTGASFAASASGTGTLAYSAYRGDGTPLSATDAGTITLPGGTIAGGILAGSLNATSTEIALDGGGTVALTNPAATEYVRFFEASPTGGDAFSGVVGFRTAAGDLPQSGRTSYSGRAEVLAVDPEATYAFDGAAEVRVDFDTARVSVRLTNLTGERRQGTEVRSTAIDSIVISNSVLSDGLFSGGTPSVTGAPFALSGSAEASGSEGALYGAGADEAAGRIVIRDPGGENATILGRYAAD